MSERFTRCPTCRSTHRLIIAGAALAAYFVALLIEALIIGSRVWTSHQAAAIATAVAVVAGVIVHYLPISTPKHR